MGILERGDSRRYYSISVIIPDAREPEGETKVHTLSRVQQMRVCLVQRLSELKLCGRNGSVSAAYKLSLNLRLTQP
jgi:hypothetical protein